MNQRVPSWDLEDVNPNHDIFKLDYEVAELTWENGQLALHELGSRRVPTKSQPTTSWEIPRAAETLEALVNQATLQLPNYKTDIAAVNDNELVPWIHHHDPTVEDAGKLNESAPMTSDALVPNSNNRAGDGSAQAQRSITSARDAGCSTRVSSCSGNPSAFLDPAVARGGGGDQAPNWSSCRDMSLSGTMATPDAYAGDFSGPRLTSTSTGSPENTSSGRDCSNSTFPDDSGCHRSTIQRDTKEVNEKKKEKVKSSIINKRRRTADIHNLSERKRRDKINQKLKTLQKLVPNSSKTDKASMLDEVIDYIKQLQLQAHTANMMNMSPMMVSLVMQQQLQLQKYLMNSMGMAGIHDMNTNIPPRFHPSAFMHMPCTWNNQLTTDQLFNTNAMPGAPMPAFLASRSQPPNMDSYSRMAALYQQMQNQPCGPFPKN